jgi:hypothetical protein
MPYGNQLIIPNFDERLKSQQSFYQKMTDGGDYSTRKDQASTKRLRNYMRSRENIDHNEALGSARSIQTGLGGMNQNLMSRTMNRLPIPHAPSEAQATLSGRGRDNAPKMANTLKQKAHKSHRVRFRTDEAQNDTASHREYANLYDKY